MFEGLKAIQPAYNDYSWLCRVKRNGIIWLIKERQFATVEWEFQEEGLYVTGRIGIVRQIDNRWSHETWFASPDGRGIDGRPLILPVEGHLSEAEEIEVYEGSNLDVLEEQLAEMKKKIANFEKSIWLSRKLSGQQSRVRYPSFSTGIAIINPRGITRSNKNSI